MKLFELRKDPLHYFTVDAKGQVLRMPREMRGFVKAVVVNGQVKTEQFKEVKATVQLPMADYLGLPSDSEVESEGKE